MYRSCIKYNVSLQAEMNDGELFDYNSQEIGNRVYLIMYIHKYHIKSSKLENY